jgi:hypothetical protein
MKKPKKLKGGVAAVVALRSFAKINAFEPTRVDKPRKKTRARRS